jgi:hypothetical protein
MNPGRRGKAATIVEGPRRESFRLLRQGKAGSVLEVEPLNPALIWA